MSILTELARRQAGLPLGGVASLDCGCAARPASLRPCAWHRREVAEALRAVTEDEVDCREACCDPA